MKLSDPAVRDHQAWIGYLQPDGLVVSAQALADQQVVIDKGSLIPLQDRFREFVREVPIDPEEPDHTVPVVADIGAFLTGFLEWPSECIAGLTTEFPLPDHLRIPLREFNEELVPSLAFYDLRKPAGDSDLPTLLVAVHPPGTDLDTPWSPHDRAWSASHTRRFERLLRETRVAIGLMATGSHFRLVYAPRGENTGMLTFPVGPMTETAGRSILGAFHLLLDGYRLLGAATNERLPALLAKSRDYQSAISETLARQVLEALYELLRGFQAANDRSHDALLGKVLASEPDQVYASLITVLLRLVFVLYAEDRGLMPGSSLYVQNYSVHGLFERLRADAERYPDTMDHRYGAWPQLLALFRAIHGGCPNPHMKMPARSGHLFDPQRFPFLEGTSDPSIPACDAPPADLANPPSSSSTLPLLSDGTVFRVLSRLVLLNGERLSYRTLDVWHIGGVYQQMMGFQLQTATGPSIAIRAPKSSGAPAIVDLHALAEVKAPERPKWLAAATGQKFTGEAEKVLKAATSTDDLLAALEKKIDRSATPHPVPRGAMILQPSDERRRSGSHYTPPALTGPIVEKTLAPILKRLASEKPAGPTPLAASLLPTPQQILDLKICDPAMGSAAFLVETCRQLADVLVASWHAHGLTPRIPPDEDEVLHARRLIAQRCLYGVDRNPLATDLAKLSLWLATLAKDHPFTFLDHSFRTGDALVGLTLKQISRFHWDDSKSVQSVLKQDDIEKTIRRVREYRDKIFALPDHSESHIAEKRQMLSVAEETVDRLRIAGDLCLAAFFAAEKPKERESLREQFALDFSAPLSSPGALWKSIHRRKALRSGLDIKDVDRLWQARSESPAQPSANPTPTTPTPATNAVSPFHWEIEFPEVFGRENPGFDAFVGNPPYGGKNTVIAGNHEQYLPWLQSLHGGPDGKDSHGNADLVAHFFRRAFSLLSHNGTFGLIATNTIRQGDTRHTGLRWICTHGGTIYAARRRYKWVGTAAVVVSVVWVAKGTQQPPFDLDGLSVPIITAYLFHDGGHENPATLDANRNKSFQGSIILGMGFTFDDTDKKGVANSLAEMERLIAKDPRNAERIFPYLGGEEVNDSPTHAHHRYVIDFADFPLRREKLDGKSWLRAHEDERKAWLRTGIVPNDYSEPVATDWPDLLAIVEARVKPDRDDQERDALRVRWWHYAEKRPGLYRSIKSARRVLVVNCGATPHVAFAFLPSGSVYANTVDVFPIEAWEPFACMQSRIHDIWVRRESSSMKDDVRYTPTDCFETFPFPPEWETNATLETVGREYYEYRAALMVEHNEGLTKTYNRFHDPHERNPKILRLRELHAAMDHAVLAAYGWSDLVDSSRTACEFIPDYYDDPKEEGGPPIPKSIRYRWPDATRDEVLARLLKLNAERAEQERLAGLAEKKSPATKKPAKPKSPKPSVPSGSHQGDLFPSGSTPDPRQTL
jgi:hypothetical protein